MGEPTEPPHVTPDELARALTALRRRYFVQYVTCAADRVDVFGLRLANEPPVNVGYIDLTNNCAWVPAPQE